MGFDRSVSPSSSIKRSSLQSSDVDENKENDHQMFVNMPKTPKKPNYMSSTISASSKAITPKKKISASEPILDNAHKPLCPQEPRSPHMAVTRFTPGKEDMDDFDRSVSSSSSSIKRSSLQSDVDENKENDHQMLVDMPKTPKKPDCVTSMISASSKAITPKKKILAERNGASEPILDDAHESLCPQEPGSPQTAVTRFTPGKEEFDSSKPYDPLTNFLSPRPQFLRYNPNKRRETFGDGETLNEETEDGLIRSSSSSPSSSMSLINGEICNLTEEEEEQVTEEEEEQVKEEEEEEEEMKMANEEIEESDNHEIEDEVRVGTKTLLLLLILGLCELFVIYVNCSTPSCGLRLQKVGIESHYYGARNHSLEAVLVKNNLQSGNGLWHQRAFESGNTVKEERDFEDIIKWSDEVKISEVTEEVEPTISEIEEESLESYYAPTVSEDQFETEVNPIEEAIDTAETTIGGEIKISEEEEGGLKTDESLESYAPTLFEDQLETEVNPIEETTIDEIFSGSTVMIRARTLIANLMRTEAELALKIFIGAVTFFTIVAYCFLGSNSKPKTNKNFAAEKESQKPLMEEEDHSFPNSLSSPIHSAEKGNEEYSKTKAPSVGFLSEFVVREINSSPSYGSYNAQVKTPKKLAGGEVSAVITPVRRSSRIRNLSIKSP